MIVGYDGLRFARQELCEMHDHEVFVAKEQSTCDRGKLIDISCAHEQLDHLYWVLALNNGYPLDYTENKVGKLVKRLVEQGGRVGGPRG